LFKNYYLNILRSPPRHTHFGTKGGRGGGRGQVLISLPNSNRRLLFRLSTSKNKQTKEPSEISGDWCQRCEMPSLFSFSVLLLSSWELFYYIEHSEPQQLRLSLSLSLSYILVHLPPQHFIWNLFDFSSFLSPSFSLLSVIFFVFETFSFFFLEFSLSLP